MARYTRWISLVVFCTLLVSAFSQPARALADGLAVAKVPFRQVTSPQPVNGPSAASSRAPGQAAPLNAPAATVSGSPVRLAWFYKPPTDGNLQTVQQNFHTFILTKNDEAARDALRAGGVTAPITQYLMAMAIHDPGSCTAQPWRNQVADRPGDFCTISAEHADWFLLDANGNRVVDPYGGERFYMMDPANPGWQAFWMERVRHSQEQLGWTGVFLDNVEASLAKRQKLGQIPARYPD
ncbi:MAG TPA: putative glycoside hydrolase, partial [Ardenticatenaceae bacterium]